MTDAALRVAQAPGPASAHPLDPASAAEYEAGRRILAAAGPLTAGSFGFPGEDGRRLVRVLAFVQDDEHGYAWAHPVDGVAAYVDLIERRVIELVDEFVLPVPQESGDYDDPAVRGPHRTTLRPIEITQPEGPSFTLEGQLL